MLRGEFLLGGFNSLPRGTQLHQNSFFADPSFFIEFYEPTSLLNGGLFVEGKSAAKKKKKKKKEGGGGESKSKYINNQTLPIIVSNCSCEIMS